MTNGIETSDGIETAELIHGFKGWLVVFTICFVILILLHLGYHLLIFSLMVKRLA